MKNLFIFFLLILIPSNTLFSAVYIYKDAKNTVFMTDKLKNENSYDKYIVDYDKYHIVYAKSEELEKMVEQAKIDEMATLNEKVFDKEISEVSKELLIEFVLIKAMIKSSSNFDSSFMNETRIGAMGLKKEWLAAAPKKVFTVKDNIKLGAMKIKEYLIEYNYDLFLALAAYYMSKEEIDKSLREIGDIPKDAALLKYLTDVITNIRVYNESDGRAVIKKEVTKGGKTIIYNEDIATPPK